MRDLFVEFIRRNSTLEKEKPNFIVILNVLEPKEIKQLFSLEYLKTKILPLISTQEMFSKVAIKAVQRGRLETLKFLILELCYNFKEIVDPNGITLLHEACLYQKIDIVKLLLEAGLDPNAIDNYGDTPLHRAVTTPSTILIEMLCKFKAKVNIMNLDKLAPIHVAAYYLNFPAILKLKEYRVNLHIKNGDGLAYYEITNMVKSGKIKVEEPALLLSNLEESNTHKALAYFYKGILSRKTNYHSLQIARKLLTEEQKQLSVPGGILIVESYFLTCSQKAEEIKEYIYKLTSTNKITVECALDIYLRFALFFRQVKQVEQAELFLDVAVNINEKPALSIEQNEYFNFITTEYNQIGKFSKAQATAQLALLKLSGAEENTLLAFLHYNLAYSQFYLMLKEKAIENYKKAFEYKPDDSDLFRAYILSLINVEEYEEAKLVCEQSKCGDEATLFSHYIMTLLGDMSWKELLSEANDYSNKPATKTTALDMKSQCLHILGDFNGSIQCILDSFMLISSEYTSLNTSTLSPINMSYSIAKVLQAFIFANQYESGLVFLKEQESKFPIEFATNFLLKALSTLVYIANQDIVKAKKVIDEIHQINPTSRFVKQLHIDLALHIIDLEDSQTIKISSTLLKDALILDPNNIQAEIYYAFLLVLLKDKEELAKISTNIDIDLLIDISKKAELLKDDVKTLSADDTIPRDSLINIEEFDPIKIHKYFQKQKQEAIANLARELLPTPERLTSWSINNNIFVTEDRNGVIKLSSIFYHGYHAMISPSLSIDHNLLVKFQMALNKGLCERKYHQNGIKFISNYVIELKIDEDARLYTTTLYKNEENNLLIIFDTIGDHKEINRKVREGKPIETVNVPSQQATKLQIESNKISTANTTSTTTTTTITANNATKGKGAVYLSI